MLQRKIREVIGCLKTLKASQYDYKSRIYGVARDLETDCMVKLALLFPLLPEYRFPEEVLSAMDAVGLYPMSTVGYCSDDQIVFRHRNERTLVNCTTGEVFRIKSELSDKPEIGSPPSISTTLPITTDF